ncbi:hypothetical protein AB0C93_16730 [Streptomyces sp. NPDC048518]|uniref:hypothetical protein n=1 Tax=Streptomyces sp. NPDC048518 TaxID=3155029 RepID=UPI0033E5778E
MDQGLAAVIAGVSGTAGAVAGAFIGALAGLRGARIGGEKTVESARLQVEGQAAAGHIQWVRSQQQQVYATLLDAHSSVEDSLRRAAAGVRGGGVLAPEARTELGSRILAMQPCLNQLSLWGPEEVVNLAQLLRAKTAEAAQALIDAQRGLPQTPGAPDHRWDLWERRFQGVADQRAQFLQCAGDVVRGSDQAAT